MKVDVEKLYNLVKEGKAGGIEFTVSPEVRDFTFIVYPEGRICYTKYEYRLFEGEDRFKNPNISTFEEIPEMIKHFLELESLLVKLGVVIPEEVQDENAR